MGVSKLLADNEFQETSLAHFASQFYASTCRQPIVAIDMPQFFFAIKCICQYWNYTNFHRIFIRRLAAFVSSGCRVVGVFDGFSTRHKLRHKRNILRNPNAPPILFMKRVLYAFSVPVIQAFDEAEAQCAILQKTGVVDAVFSSDADSLVFGASCVIRYAPQSPKAHLNATHDSVSALQRNLLLVEVPNGSQNSFITRAIIQGNDFDAGLERVGHKVAKQIADLGTGFSAELCALASIPHSMLKQKRDEFVQRLEHELNTNESAYFNRRCKITVPSDFPQVDLVRSFLQPKVIAINPQDLVWSEPDIPALQLLWMGASPIVAPKAILQQGLPSTRQIHLSTEEQFNLAVMPSWYTWHVLQGTDKASWVGKISTEELVSSILMSAAFHLPRKVILPTYILRLSNRGCNSVPTGHRSIKDHFQSIRANTNKVAPSVSFAGETITPQVPTEESESIQNRCEADAILSVAQPSIDCSTPAEQFELGSPKSESTEASSTPSVRNSPPSPDKHNGSSVPSPIIPSVPVPPKFSVLLSQTQTLTESNLDTKIIPIGVPSATTQKRILARKQPSMKGPRRTVRIAKRSLSDTPLIGQTTLSSWLTAASSAK